MSTQTQRRAAGAAAREASSTWLTFICTQTPCLFFLFNSLRTASSAWRVDMLQRCQDFNSDCRLIKKKATRKRRSENGRPLNWIFTCAYKSCVWLAGMAGLRSPHECNPIMHRGAEDSSALFPTRTAALYKKKRAAVRVGKIKKSHMCANKVW